ncbi:hypothetical protein ACFTWD_21700 [Streptomyces sp. NPDC056943]|uniref:hypothetical protein n=1 Tax=Streptomyces sp. NPDC056943 TaxID=3345971 RepID=UPI003643883E
MTTTSSFLSSVPAQCVVPAFESVRSRRGRRGPLRALSRGRRAPVVLLALTVAALAAATASHSGASPPGAAVTPRARPPAAVPVVRLVSAPVRIADAETVRLLRAGDRVDVIAAPNSPMGGAGEARVVATGARVAEVPRSGETRSDGGALVVLSVPRSTAAALAGAGVTSQLAVTLC